MLRLCALAVGASAAAPALNLLDNGKCGKAASGLDEAGVFNLSISVVGKKGFSYDCSTAFDPAVGVADGECIGWAPAEVMSGEEGLDISLRALDAGGKLATCMQWELVFDPADASADAWVPSGRSANLKELIRQRASTSDVANPPNGTGGGEKGRKVALSQYLDSMTHLSHRCVPKDTPAYWPIWKWPPAILEKSFGFPPTAHTELQLRLSHALLASTGTIWSIDRSCKDDLWYNPTPIYESCILSIPGIPDAHCHLICNQTWSLGPGGIASWGISSLNHHIPSPGVSLVEDSPGPAGVEYGDKGCGDARRA